MSEIGRIVDHFAPQLKAAGWRKQKLTFNRDLDNGVVHVISFQQGRWETPHPSSLFGRFTVNLAITLRTKEWTPTGFVSEASCRFRTRIGSLLDEPADPWWPIDEPEVAIRELEPLFERAFALFDTMQTPLQLRDAAASPHRVGPHWWGRHRLIAAMMSLEFGDRRAAQRQYTAHFSDDNYRLRPYQVAFGREHGLRVPWFAVSPLGLRLRARRAKLDDYKSDDRYYRLYPELAPRRSLLWRLKRWARA